MTLVLPMLVQGPFRAISLSTVTNKSSVDLICCASVTFLRLVIVVRRARVLLQVSLIVDGASTVTLTLRRAINVKPLVLHIATIN